MPIIYSLVSRGNVVLAEHTESSAIHFCTSIQKSFLKVPWPQSIISSPLYVIYIIYSFFPSFFLFLFFVLILFRGAKIENDSGVVIWNGLRVVMAINSGLPNSSLDPATRRTKYVCVLITLLLTFIDFLILSLGALLQK